jgi:hypothetical protein
MDAAPIFIPAAGPRMTAAGRMRDPARARGVVAPGRPDGHG